jgi:hypothetical protein
MQSNIVICAYKRTYTTTFVMSSHFTGAIKELREIKDDLSPSHPEQSINTPRLQNPQTTAQTFRSPHLSPYVSQGSHSNR